MRFIKSVSNYLQGGWVYFCCRERKTYPWKPSILTGGCVGACDGLKQFCSCECAGALTYSPISRFALNVWINTTQLCCHKSHTQVFMRDHVSGFYFQKRMPAYCGRGVVCVQVQRAKQ